MGCDFTYVDAEHYYNSLDNLINFVNANYGDKYHMKYATPSDYVKALASYDLKWPTKYDDMMPYADSPHQYWTGYFTARPNNKAYIREGSHNFHASSQLYTLAVLNQSASQDEVDQVLAAKNEMLDKLGIVSHHDSVTGTGNQHTADDYSAKIAKGISLNNPVYGKAIADQIFSKAGQYSDMEWKQCLATNTTYKDCPIAA